MSTTWARLAGAVSPAAGLCVRFGQVAADVHTLSTGNIKGVLSGVRNHGGKTCPQLLEDIGLASRTETGKGTMIYMSPESWEHVRPHVARLLELTAADED